jgi:hypothetical protein
MATSRTKSAIAYGKGKVGKTPKPSSGTSSGNTSQYPSKRYKGKDYSLTKTPPAQMGRF